MAFSCTTILLPKEVRGTIGAVVDVLSVTECLGVAMLKGEDTGSAIAKPSFSSLRDR